MLKMDEINKIKKSSSIDGKSRPEISDKFNRSWATVDKYVSATSDELKDRGKRSRKSLIITDEVKQRIQEFIDDEIVRKVHRKQRYRSVYIFKQLKKEGIYTGSERQLRKVISKIREDQRQRIKENPSFLDLHFKHGHYLQFDHGEAIVEIDGIEIQGYLFVASVPGLVMRYCQFFITKETAAWGEFHNRAFNFFGGVFENCIYDNDSALIVHSTKLPTSLFKDIIAHFDINIILCNKAAGWEKGAVENAVGYCRRNFLAGKPSFLDLKNLNTHLLNESSNDIITEKHYETDAPLSDGWKILNTTLKECPASQEWGVWEDLLVNSRQHIRYKNYRYSVPEKYVGEIVKCFMSTSEIKIYDQQDNHIFTHTRRYLEADDGLIIDHYYEQLSRKPGAFEFAKVVQSYSFSKDSMSKSFGLFKPKFKRRIRLSQAVST